MSDKEKITKIIAKNGVYNGKSLSFDYYVIQPEELADALIANGCGDVSEWKRRAEVAEKERDIMKAALDNLIFYCTNDKKFMCEAVSEKCPRRNGTLLCGSDECGKIMLDFYIEEAKRGLKYEITEERK